MIISASYRTDIPAFFGDWFRQRLDAGYALVKNPYGGKLTRVDLSPGSVDGFVFWTRNATPFRGQLDALLRQNIPFIVQYTLTGYPRSMEIATPPPDRAIESMMELANAYGPRAVIWRYDPIVMTIEQTAAWHLDRFRRLADKLAGVSDEVVISFMEPYLKTRRNMAKAGQNGAFSLVLPDQEQKLKLAKQLRITAKERGFRLTACTQPGLDIAPAACIDRHRLSDIAGRDLDARTKGNRPGCQCAEARDIGRYDTCAQGCAYCYAVSAVERARDYLRNHDPFAEML